MSTASEMPAGGKDAAPAPKPETAKTEALRPHTEDGLDQALTTNQGVRISDNQNSLKAGPRGPTLLEDFIFREKMTHFDHERIPERIVHARGSAAHGYFQAYESQAALTRAHFLQDPEAQTPVFVRFSTVAGSRGSTDLARDVRGFAVKFYTQEGVFDLVGNNMPVFFIQDAMKFPDLVHAVKPEPHNEIPQAASAHDTFWDFISVMPESMHMVQWLMSDRAVPRSYRMMEGFGVHTFRLVNAEGVSHFVKFHWKPLLGMAQVVWDEAQKISGKSPDFHRGDLWEAIEGGDFPEWELGIQVVAEEDEHKFDFDLLDPTKLIPEELVPVQRIGKLVLNRNPDNFFAETEQVAFHIGHVVPGIDFTNDPLLQGRLFSYTDTQLKRLGGPNFHEIPINRSLAPVHNNQRDGHMRQTINRGRVSYEPNTLARGCPFQAAAAEGGFASYAEKIDAHKVRERSDSFFDHYTQAALFYDSQAPHEQAHIAKAFSFELGMVESVPIRKRMLVHLDRVNEGLAATVAANLGLAVPDEAELEHPLNLGFPADADYARYQPRPRRDVAPSPALSMTALPGQGIRTRKVAFLAADGVDGDDLQAMKAALEAEGAKVKVIGPRLGAVRTTDGKGVMVDVGLLNAASVLFDAVFVPGGEESAAALALEADALHFVNEAFKHCKAVAASGAGVDFLRATVLGSVGALDGGDAAVVTGDAAAGVAGAFIDAIAQHRNWARETKAGIPA
ncbi:MAG TPA: catalase [Longimicrobiaceae bacterium]|nr:catalase [Longimicrobiaceae bacterium]